MQLAQTTQPVFEIDLSRWKQAASMFVLGACVGLYHDLNEWMKAPQGSPFDVRKTIVRMTAAGLAFAGVGFGLNINTINGWL